MRSLGQFGPITVLPNVEVTGTFTVTKIKKLKRPGHYCEEDDQYSYNDCLRSYVMRMTNCNIDAFSNNFNCTLDGIVKLYDTLIWLKLSTQKTTIEITGCLPKCTRLKYEFKRTAKVTWKKDWKKDWISSFYLSTSSTTQSTTVENYSYDEQVFMKLDIRFIRYLEYK